MKTRPMAFDAAWKAQDLILGPGSEGRDSSLKNQANTLQSA